MSDLFLRPLFTWRSAMASAYGPPNPTTRHVLLTLALHMNEKGESCYPTIEQLATETALSRRAVIYNMAQAEADGWIGKRETPMTGKGQGWRRIEYFPIIPNGIEEALKTAKIEGGAPGSPRQGGASGDKGGAFNDTKVVHQVHPSTSRSTSKSTPGRATRLPTDFEMPEPWLVWAMGEQPTWNMEHSIKISAMFKDFWIAKAGKDGAKLNWQATWRNWVRKEGPMPGPGRAVAQAPRPPVECQYVDRPGADICGMPNAKPDPLYSMKPICEHHHLKLAKPAVSLERVNEHMANIKRAARAQA